MSSFKDKKAKTLATRKRTQKRLRDSGLGPDSSSGWNKRVNLYAHQSVASNETPFVQCATFQGPREGYVFRKGALGMGYYVDGKEGSLESDLACIKSVLIKPQVTLFSSKTTAIEELRLHLKELRANDGRLHKRVVILVDDEKYFISLPSKLGVTQIQNKVRSKKGMGSGKNANYTFTKFSNIEQEHTNKEVVNILNDFKSGKIHTLLVTDASVLRIAPVVSKVHVFIQLSKFPSLITYKERMANMMTDVNTEREYNCFFYQTSNKDQDLLDFIVECGGPIVDMKTVVPE